MNKYINVVLTASTGGLSGGLRAAAGQVTKFEGDVRKSSKGMADGAKKIAVGFAAAGLAITLALAGGVKTAIQFEQKMRNVTSLLTTGMGAGELEAEFASMSKSAVALSREVPQSLSVLADALYEVTSSGFAGAEAIAVVETAAKAASAGASTADVAVQGITQSLNAYGLGAEYANDVSDILFQTVNLGVVTFEELVTQLGDVVGSAAAGGVALDQVGAAIAAMTLAGLSGSEATTSLNQLLRAMIQPSEQLSVVLDSLGYESGAQALEIDGLYGVMMKLQDATGGNLASLMQLFPEIRAGRGAYALLSAGGANYARTVEGIAEVETRQGATQRAFNEQSKATAFQLNLLKNNVIAAGQSIGATFLPFINRAVSVLNGLSGDAISGCIAGFGRLAELWHNVKQIGGDVVTIFRNLWDSTDTLRNGLGALVGIGIVGTLTGITGAVAGMTGFLADNREVVLALAGVYLATLVPALVATTARMLALAPTWVGVQLLNIQSGISRVASSAMVGGPALIALAVGAAAVGVAFGAASKDVSRLQQELGRLNETPEDALANIEEIYRRISSLGENRTGVGRLFGDDDRIQAQALAAQVETLIQTAPEAARALLDTAEAAGQIRRNADGSYTALNSGLFGSNLQAIVVASADDMRDVASGVGEVGGAAEGAEGAVDEFGATIDQATQSFADGMGMDIEAAQALIAVLDDVKAATASSFTAAADPLSGFDPTTAEEQAAAVADATDGVAEATDALEQAESRRADNVRAVGDSLEGLADAEAAVGDAREDAADQVEDASDALVDAQDAVGEAAADAADQVEDASDALVDAQDAVGEAAADAAEAVEAANRQIIDAQDAVVEADDALAESQQNLTDARRDARQEVEDLADAVDESASSEERALIAVDRAREQLHETMRDGSASALDVREATLSLEDAERALRDVRSANDENAAALEEANRRGIDGSDQVVDAREAVADAEQRVADAQQSVADAQEALVDAQVDGAQRVADAQQSVADAQEALADAQADGAERVQAALEAVADAQTAYGAAQSGAAEDEAAVAAARRDLADASGALLDAQGGVMSQGAQLSQFYTEQVAEATQFVEDIRLAAEMGLDPQVLVRLLQAGPEQAGPLVAAMVSDSSGALVTMVNDSEAALRAINATAVELARLTQLAVSSSTDEMGRNLSAAMEIATINGREGGRRTSQAIAEELGIGVAQVQQIANDFGIVLADSFNQVLGSIGREKIVTPTGKTYGGESGAARMLNSGGSVPGYGHTDTVPAILTPGEVVVRKPIAALPGMTAALLRVNAGDPRAVSALTGDGIGPQHLNIGGVAGDHPDMGGAGAKTQEAVSWARSQHGKPYRLGGAGPGAYDCSGFIAAVQNVLQGNPIHRRLYYSGSSPAELRATGLVPGKGTFTMGMSTAAEMRSTYGHVGGTIAGVNIESNGSQGVVVGGRVGADHPMFRRHWMLPEVGGQFVSGGGGGGGGGWAIQLPPAPTIAGKGTFGDVANQTMAYARDAAQAWTDANAGFGGEGGGGLSPEQIDAIRATGGDVSRMILNVAQQLNVDAFGKLSMMETAIVESGDVPPSNPNHGDRDSLGTFQQRAPWGPVADRMDPAKSANMFFTGGQGGQKGQFAYHRPPGKVWDGTAGSLSQKVQVSGHGERYDQREAEARAILRALGVEGFTGVGAPPAGGGGRLQAGAGIDAMNAAFDESGIPHRTSSAYRPGDDGYHGRRRAIDLVGPVPSVNSPELLRINRWLADNYPHATELIYAGPGGVNLKNGRPHRYSADTMAQHENHNHWAMRAGGVVPADGSILRPYVRDRGGPLRPGFTFNGTGAAETVIGPGGLGDAAGGFVEAVDRAGIDFGRAIGDAARAGVPDRYGGPKTPTGPGSDDGGTNPAAPYDRRMVEDLAGQASGSAAEIDKYIESIENLMDIWDEQVAAAEAAAARQELVDRQGEAQDSLDVAVALEAEAQARYEEAFAANQAAAGTDNATQATRDAVDAHRAFERAQEGRADAEEVVGDASEQVAEHDRDAARAAVERAAANEVARLELEARAQAEVEAHRAMLDANRDLMAFDEMAVDQQLADLERRLAAEETYTDAWMDLHQQRSGLLADEADAALNARDDAEQAQQDALDDLNQLLDERADILTAIEEEKADHDERMADLEAAAASDRVRVRLRERDDLARVEEQAADDRKAVRLRERDDLARVEEQAADDRKAVRRAAAEDTEKIEEARLERLVELNEAHSERIDDVLRDRQRTLVNWANIAERVVPDFGNNIGAVTRNVQKQTAQFRDWMNGLAALQRRGLSADVIEMMGLDDSPEALGQVMALQSATTAEIDELNRQVQVRTELAGAQLQRERNHQGSQLSADLQAMKVEHDEAVLVLNQEAAEDTRVNARQMRDDVAKINSAMRTDVAEIRAESAKDIKAINKKLAADVAEIRAESAQDIKAINKKLAADVAEQNADFREQMGEHKAALRNLGRDTGRGMTEALAEAMRAGIPAVSSAARAVVNATDVLEEAQQRYDTAAERSRQGSLARSAKPDTDDFFSGGVVYEGRGGTFLKLNGKWYQANGTGQRRGIINLYGAPRRMDSPPDRIQGYVQNLFGGAGGIERFIATAPKRRPYDVGGVLPPGLTMAWNGLGEAEYVLKRLRGQDVDRSMPQQSMPDANVTVVAQVILDGRVVQETVTRGQRAEQARDAVRRGRSLSPAGR